jgi:hypothetical protein
MTRRMKISVFSVGNINTDVGMMLNFFRPWSVSRWSANINANSFPI